MENKQTKLLTKLSDKLKSETFNRERVVFTLTQAKIITRQENFTKQFANLGKVTKDSC
jgi:EAL domain-containing protein (putative c-di-GMP-specific phosphodiesterase class I)